MKATPDVYQNSLFSALPDECRLRLAPHLRLVPLVEGRILYAPDNPLTRVYFPIDAIVAVVYLVDDGASSEVCMIGREGMVGVFSLLSDEVTANEAQVLSSGYAYSLPKRIIQQEFDRHESCFRLMLKYIQSLCAQMSQTAVCNRHHTIDQQLCRLLLLSLDRLPCNNVNMTHDLIAYMLGVRRGSVTEAAGRLQREHIIEYRRGHIKVLDRTGLERLCCECYFVVKRETEKLLPLQLTPAQENKAGSCLGHGMEQTCSHCYKLNGCKYRKETIRPIRFRKDYQQNDYQQEERDDESRLPESLSQPVTLSRPTAALSRQSNG